MTGTAGLTGTTGFGGATTFCGGMYTGIPGLALNTTPPMGTPGLTTGPLGIGFGATIGGLPGTGTTAGLTGTTAGLTGATAGRTGTTGFTPIGIPTIGLALN